MMTMRVRVRNWRTFGQVTDVERQLVAQNEITLLYGTCDKNCVEGDGKVRDETTSFMIILHGMPPWTGLVGGETCTCVTWWLASEIIQSGSTHGGLLTQDLYGGLVRGMRSNTNNTKEGGRDFVECMTLETEVRGAWLQTSGIPSRDVGTRLCKLRTNNTTVLGWKD